MILDKMRSCLRKLELGFWTYGLIRLLAPSFNVGWPPYLEPKQVKVYILFPEKLFIDG